MNAVVIFSFKKFALKFCKSGDTKFSLFKDEITYCTRPCHWCIHDTEAHLSPQGVQAQTVANFYLAFERDLTIIPVLNKIDLPGAKPDLVRDQLRTLFDFESADVLEVNAISSRHGKNLSTFT